MRSIKFRAWDPQTKKIRKVVTLGWGADSEMDHLGNIIGVDCMALQEEDRGTIRIIDPPIIEQFTGLLDSEKKEIYEGDVIELPSAIDGVIRYLVNFRSGAFMCDQVNGRPIRNHLWAFADRSRVVGNIHENPELLK